MYEFIPGQRCISDAELQKGLGTILTVEFRTVTVLFMATGETRTYARQTAPLTRVEFAVGDTVTSHDGVAIKVAEVQEHSGLLTYIGNDDHGRRVEMDEAQLDNFMQLNRPSERLFNGQIDQDKWFELRYQTLQHRNRLAHSELYGLTGCRTSLIPHQLYIAYEVATRFAPRVLLADEVGLGKTIEAGLILHRQLLTGHAHRVLIVVPETLVHQWLVEMLRRFNLHFRIFDRDRWEALTAIDEDTEEAHADENPFHSEQLVLCSIEFLCSHPGVYEQALSGEWDMLIVDEAHHLVWSPEQSSEEYNKIEKLAGLTDGVLLLTATPEQLGKQSHFARLRLLDPDRFPEFEQFIEEERAYEPIAQVVEDLLGDKQLNAGDIEVIRATFNEGDNEDKLDALQQSDTGSESNRIARLELVEHLLDRHGTGRVLFRNTRAAVKGFPQRQVFSYPLPMPPGYAPLPRDADTATALLLAPERLYTESGVGAWTEVDPRIGWLTAKLSDLHPAKVLVIASSAQTALDLSQYLRTRTSLHAVVFHEGLSIVERDRAAAGFADMETGAQVMVCSEIGSEGRNFQFAHHMILFDLPLNPDLLEQRIGRLDRIGQTETIRIHVPYLENSAQSTLFRWYHEGLNAFEHTCPAGHAVYTAFHQQLHSLLHDDKSAEIENLLEQAKALHHEMTESLHRGRDRLLEYNSCRMQVAENLRERALELDHSSVLADYMDAVYDCFGVDTELHSENCLVIRPTEHMINRFPGLPDDGMTITYDRDTALSFEDAHYITWEHPLVDNAMEMLITSENGNTSVIALPYKGVAPGTLMLECLFSLEAPPIESLQVDRFLPPTTIRVVIDEKGIDHNNRLPHRFVMQGRQHVDIETANKIVRAKQKVLKALLQRSEKNAQAQVPAYLKEARENSSNALAREINRLRALALVNPNVRQEEIQYFEQRLELLTEVLYSANIRLDALRVIVAT